MKKKTLGQVATEILKDSPISVTPQEVWDMQEKDYRKRLFETLESGKKVYKDDFWIEVTTSYISGIQGDFIPNALIARFIHRHSPPTPNTNQTVYWYRKSTDELGLWWAIPDSYACDWLMNNKDDLPADQHELMKMVFAFKHGILLKKVKELNNEYEADLVIVDAPK